MKAEITFYGDTVDYVLGDVQISGRITTFHTGRCQEFSFEPSWFIDSNSEEYWNNHWEDIEQEILDNEFFSFESF